MCFPLSEKDCLIFSLKKKCLPANLALITKKATHHIICPMKFEISDYNLQYQNFSDSLEGEFLRFLPS